jgi:hypothetical protein
MSSYQLSNDQFQQIANWFYQVGCTKSDRLHWPIRIFLGFDPGDELYHATEEDIKEKSAMLTRNLYNLNRLALVTRYGASYDKYDEVIFEPRKVLWMNNGDVIETLQSLRYQCSEYMTSDTSLYKELKAFIGEACEVLFDQSRQ